MNLLKKNNQQRGPALRVKTFDSMAATHIAGDWYTEAAVCQAHSLMIIGLELQRKSLLCPLDWTVLDVLSEQIAIEEGKSETQVDEQIPASFTLSDFLHKFDELVRSLMRAERYEAIGPVSRLVIPIFERSFDFKALISIYSQIHQACVRAEKVRTIRGKRHQQLATYFKVAFYGQLHFGLEHGTEWIYRERPLTSLAEVSERMRESVRMSLGHDRVQILAGDASSSLSSSDPSIAYLAIAHVEPYMTIKNVAMKKGGLNCSELNETLSEEDTLEDPNNNYLLHTNVKTFVMVEKLTDSRVPDNAPELARTTLKRLTITVENPFPSIRRRQRVVRTEESVLSPLELACECILQKAAQIRRVLAAAGIHRCRHQHDHHRSIGGYDKSALKRVDLKQLQLLLQGSVNVGLLGYAETFTAPDQRKRYGRKGLCRLWNALKTLNDELDEAMRVNEAAMSGERSEYQQMLRQSFDAVQEKLCKFFDCINTNVEK